MTHVSLLAIGVFAFYSHVTNVTLKTLKIHQCITKVSIHLLAFMLFAVNACILMQTIILKC